MDVLRQRGDFIEYPQGTPPPPNEDQDVLTVAEGGENGIARMYRFYPEEFPQIYKKRDERAVATRRAVTEIVQIVAGK
jgi:hypothetical protein